MTMTNSATASQPLVDLQRLVVAIRRKRRFVLTFALVGLLAGMALTVLAPAKPTAVTRLLVVHEQDQPTDGGTLIRTDVALLETTRVAGAALEMLGIAERPEDFLKAYNAAGLTNNVLELTVQGTSDADAVARAQALADAFIADHVRRIQEAARADAQALINQRDQDKAELAELDTAIAAATGEDQPSTPAELASLFARRAELDARVQDLTKRAAEAAVGAPRAAAGTQIVDAPRVLPSSPLRTAATNGLVGLVLGLSIGLMLAAVSTVVRDRPVLRRDIAANLGASVIAQLPAPRRGLARLWRPARRAAERMRVAAMLVRAVRNDTTAVSLVELGAPRTAAELATDMAERLAEDGPVLLVHDLARGKLRLGGDKLRKADKARNRNKPQPIRIVDTGDRSIGRYPPTGQRERQVGVGSATPGTAWTDLLQLGSETVLVVRAGYANTAWLHTVARQLADLQLPVIGIVLVDPDPRDRTDGTLWDGLHTAIRGRNRVYSVPPAEGHGAPLANGAARAAVSANGDDTGLPGRLPVQGRPGKRDVEIP